MSISYGPDGEMYFGSTNRPLYPDERGKALNVEQYAKLMRHRWRRQEWVGQGHDRIQISTVFLGADMNWHPHGRPLLFETMAFSETGADVIARYCTRRDAKTGHRQSVRAARRYVKAQRARRWAANAGRRRMHSNYRARRA